MESKDNILIIDKDIKFTNSLSNYLEKKGFIAFGVRTKELMLRLFEANTFSFVVIGSLPNDFRIIDVLETIKDVNDEIRIIVIYSSISEKQSIEELHINNCKLIPNKQNPKKIYNHIVSHEEQTDVEPVYEINDEVLYFGKFSFSVSQRLLTLNYEKEDDKTVMMLTKKEGALLQLLASKPNHIVTRECLYKNIWNDKRYYNTRSMDVYVSKLRKYLSSDKNIQIINRHDIGFVLKIKPNK